ncbi:MAG: phage terminase large subunit, partial [Turicimonas muris]
PDGGAIFKDEWFKFWPPTSLPPKFDTTLISWDMTFKDSKNADYVVGQVWGKKSGCYYLLDQVRGQWDFVKTREMFLQLSAKYPKALRKLVEDKANGSAIISELKKTISGIIPITPRESKESRANAVTPFFEAGNVYFPDKTVFPWVDSLIAEFLSFPAGSHDDCVDSTTQALNYFREHSGLLLDSATMKALRTPPRF